MAYFAELDDNNIVIRVIAVSDNDAPDPAPSDDAGNQFLASIGLSGRWLQTSYNNNIRKQYAGIGYLYDETADVFVAPQPFPSWTLDDSHDWQAPVPRPTEGRWYWDEDSLEWIELD